MNGGEKVVGHVFISYVREDSHQVDRLQQTLQSAGIPVWRDTADLWPGEDWRAKIRRAITDDALVFIACFSRSSLARVKSYQNEELILAVEQMRQRQPEQPWLIPVRLDDCEIPDREIGGGVRLSSLQRVNLFGDHSHEGYERLITAILRVLHRPSNAAPPRPQGEDLAPDHGLRGEPTVSYLDAITPEIRVALSSPIQGVRAGVIDELESLLSADIPSLRDSARLALSQLRDDSSERVSAAAAKALGLYRMCPAQQKVGVGATKIRLQVPRTEKHEPKSESASSIHTPPAAGSSTEYVFSSFALLNDETMARRVKEVTFTTTRLGPGYDQEEVDRFLDEIIDTFTGFRHPPLTPAEIRNKQFTTTRLRAGYDEREVDTFLDEVELKLAEYSMQPY
jgi:DivIVA domain-containing protein